METQNQPKTTIYKTDNGGLFSDAGCKVIQLEFGNLFLRFDMNGLEGFAACIEALKLDKYEEGNAKKPYHRKIFVALQPSGITIAFHREEIEELRGLLRSARAILMLKKLSHEALNYPQN
jgi:hypothetical protein